MLEAHLKEESLNPLDTFYKSSLSPYLIFHRIQKKQNYGIEINILQWRILKLFKSRVSGYYKLEKLNNAFFFVMINQAFKSETLSQLTCTSTQLQFPAVKIERSKLTKFNTDLQKLAVKMKIKNYLFMIQKKQIEQQLLEQQLNFRHRQKLSIVDETRQKWFEPHQRIGPYRANFKKTLVQLKNLLKKKDENLCLSYNKYTPEQIKALLHSLKQIEDEQNLVLLKSLYMSWARTINIIHYMQFKNFARLKIINIGGNFVESIELLSRVYLPEVEDVYLWNNNITQIRSLKRCLWPNLKTLDLHVNKIADVKDLRYLGNQVISTVIFDSNIITNFNEAIVMCSQSPKSKIAATSNQVVKWMGRPRQRFRKRAIEVRTCTMKVRYI